MTTTHIERFVRETVRTHDHARIKHWAENRGGTPAVVEGSWDGRTGELRIDFGESIESLIEITWEDFFNILDESNLDFMYQKNNDTETGAFVERE